MQIDKVRSYCAKIRSAIQNNRVKLFKSPHHNIVYVLKSIVYMYSQVFIDSVYIHVRASASEHEFGQENWRGVQGVHDLEKHSR